MLSLYQKTLSNSRPPPPPIGNYSKIIGNIKKWAKSFNLLRFLLHQQGSVDYNILSANGQVLYRLIYAPERGTPLLPCS